MRDLGHEYTDEQIKDLERRINSVYSEAKKDLDKKVDEFYRKHAIKDSIHAQQVKDGTWTREEYNNWIQGQLFQSKQWEAKRDQLTKTITEANKTAMDIINEDTKNVFGYNATYMNYTLEHGAGIDLGFGLYDQKTIETLLKDNPQTLPQWKINEQKDYVWNKKLVNNAVTQGILQGESIDKISKRITESLCMQNESLSRTFARTAMTEAENAGRLQSLEDAEEMGIEVYKMWMATLDDRTRDSHRELDGESVPTNEKFSNGLMYPGDPSGDAHEIYNCRCTMVGDVKKYPAEYERHDSINGMTIRNMTYNEWEKIKTAEKKTGIATFLPTPTKFKKDFDTAKATITKNAWRVDDTYTVEDYKHKKLFELYGGSTVAVTDEGDIVSVCKNAVGEDRGSDLLKIAVANGGDRLDAFGEDLYHFYTKNGFEPVSWTPFNEEYAPHDWVKGIDKPEPVIFYMYTGQTTDTSYSDFLSNISPCVGENGYGDAMVMRNKLIDSKK